MKLEPFCAWGDGPDVGINVYTKSGELVPLDFTAAEARALATDLVAVAEFAEALQRSAEERDKYIVEIEGSDARPGDAEEK